MALQPLAISLDSFLAYTATVPFSLLRLPQIKGRRLFSVQCNFYFFKPCIIYIHYRGVDTSSFKRIHRGYRAATQLLRCWRLLSYIFLYLHVICVELQVLVNCGAAPELQSIGCSKKGVHVNRWPQLLWNFGQHLWPHYHDTQPLAKRQNSCVSSLCQKFFNLMVGNRHGSWLTQLVHCTYCNTWWFFRRGYTWIQNNLQWFLCKVVVYSINLCICTVW